MKRRSPERRHNRPARAYSEDSYDSYSDYPDDVFTAARGQDNGYAEVSIMEYLGNTEAEKIAKRNRAKTIKNKSDEKIASIGTLLGKLTGKSETEPGTQEHRSYIGDNTKVCL